MPDIHVNVFNDVLKAIESVETEPDRHLSIQIDGRLRDVIRAVRASNKPGKVTVEIKVTPGPDGRQTFSGGVKATIPNPPTNSVTLWTDDVGDLHRSNPAQLKLPNTGPRLVDKKEGN